MQVDQVKSFASNMVPVMEKWQQTAGHLVKTAMSPELLKGYVHACPFLDLTGDVVMAWMLLWRAVVASEKLEGKVKKKDKAFYEGQIKTAQFFIRSVLPISSGRADSILDTCGAPVELEDDGFGGK